jgi:tetrahydromethanopterin S-methyltransferase subunit D
VGHFLSLLGGALVLLWIVANVLDLGPIREAAGVALTWAIGLAGLTAIIASVSVLGWGLVLGRTSPVWIRFVQQARTAAAVFGCVLIVIGLLHYRDTEPRGDIVWLVFGLAVLACAAVVHGWLAVNDRRNLT